MRAGGATRKTGDMDDHAAPPTIPYPPAAVGTERKMLELFAAGGIICIAAAIAVMGFAMYFLPGAPPNLPLPLF
ncbi:MAG: hypothetical protein JWM53_6034 [bacterium]|nr:hypothetical protein [bacterium]